VHAERGEEQYRENIEFLKKRGIEPLGISTAWALFDDPKRLTFTFARYKFVAKMFEEFGDVLEVGCGDGFATRVVAQAVQSVTAIDFDPAFIDDARLRPTDRWAIRFGCHDMLDGPYPGMYQGIFALDVLEHIAPADEDRFLRNMIASLGPAGVMLLGMPTLASQAYASPQSKAGHKNCKELPEFRATMQRYFENVFMFCMNDEVVHTGYHKMAHYVFALCCGRRSEPGGAAIPSA
jgi:2-polyprenyl-3-methyl-5-hydroxy-6-metoxy-1,4-benzoquinol methylase